MQHDTSHLHSGQSIKFELGKHVHDNSDGAKSNYYPQTRHRSLQERAGEGRKVKNKATNLEAGYVTFVAQASQEKTEDRKQMD